MMLRSCFSASSLSVVLFLGAVGACSSSSSPPPSGEGPGDDGGFVQMDTGGFVPHVPTNHIPTAIACTSHEDAGQLDACVTNADCLPTGGCMCGSEILAGEDLPDGSALDAGATDAGPAGPAPNECVEAQCLTDSGCGAGGYCSPSLVPACAPMGTVGFFCHTKNDTCDDDGDCAATNGACVWLGQWWGCVPTTC